MCWLICEHNTPLPPLGVTNDSPSKTFGLSMTYYSVLSWSLVNMAQYMYSISGRNCPPCPASILVRCTTSRKCLSERKSVNSNDIAILIAIVRTADIKPPVYQFVQSSAPKFVHRIKIPP